MALDESAGFPGQTDRQRVPASECLLNKPELASLGPAYLFKSRAEVTAMGLSGEV
jgi:hypothetical protein